MSEIKIDTEGAVRILTISNEPLRNAFAHDMAADLLRGFDEADADPGIRVVVVTGAGDIAFSSGHDLKEIASGAYADSGLGELPFLRPLTMKKPVIAAVNGHCYAAAFILALSCDLRVVSSNASFGSPGARLGMLPEGGQLGRLPQLMSPARALELMYTAQPMDAEDAYAHRFASRLVPQGQALAAALELAQTIAANAPDVIAAIKHGVNLGLHGGPEEATRYEESIARDLEQLPAAKEGVSAFLEKRTPVFADATQDA